VAIRFAELWRTRQLEYSFRRGLMRAYRPFSVCTWEALLYTQKALGMILGEESRADLMQQYKKLPPLLGAALGLTSIKNAANLLASFSNGEAKVVRGVLENAKLLQLFDDIVNANEVRTFKPDPAIYAHAVQRLSQAANTLVSSNPFDIIGETTAGLRAAWVKRDPKTVFDP
jgi:2-haloacid dehalogenase